MSQAPLTPGQRFYETMATGHPLQMVGTISANHTLPTRHIGFKAIYLPGGGVVASFLDPPDLGISGLDDMLIDVCRITNVCDLPLLMNVDIGFGSSVLNVARTVESMVKSGVAAMCIEDQVGAKRCGHRPNKEIISQQEIVDRVKATVGTCNDDSLVITACTDALVVEGLQAAIDRACARVEAGADVIFPEATTKLAMHKEFTAVVKVPVLTDITELGATPLFATDELTSVDASLVLYPPSAFRVMNKVAENVYIVIHHDGIQKSVIGTMQARMELYDHIDYHSLEQKLGALSARKRSA